MTLEGIGSRTAMDVYEVATDVKHVAHRRAARLTKPEVPRFLSSPQT